MKTNVRKTIELKILNYSSNKMKTDIIIEIPYNSNIKYEFDHDQNRLRVDRIINTPMVYPTHYGYIPNTIAEDQDELDVLLVSSHPFIPGCIIETKVIGVLLMEDEKGLDHKIITTISENVNTLEDLDEITLNKIKYFFEHYKDLEKNKWSKVLRFGDENEANEIINSSKIKY